MTSKEKPFYQHILFARILPVLVLALVVIGWWIKLPLWGWIAWFLASLVCGYVGYRGWLRSQPQGHGVAGADAAMSGQKKARPGLASDKVDSDARLAKRQQARQFLRNMLWHKTPHTLPQDASKGHKKAPPSPQAEAELRLLRRWVRIQFPGDQVVLAFVFLDGADGLTAIGDTVSAIPTQAQITQVIERPGQTIRLHPLYAWDLEVISGGIYKSYQLPALPPWYNASSPGGEISRFFVEDPLLRMHFAPDFPGDIQVIVYDGGPRCSDVPPEAVWVRLLGRPWPLYFGQILNQPQQLQHVAAGDQILFGIKSSQVLPFQLKDEYLQEREQWFIAPCDQCSFDELFDAPSQLIAASRAGLREAAPTAFSSYCPMCGGLQQVRMRKTMDAPKRKIV